MAVILGLKFGNSTEFSKGFSVLVVVIFLPIRGSIQVVVGPSKGGRYRVRHSHWTCSAGQSITVAVNLLFTFIIAQSFLSLLRAFKFGILLFFASWITVMMIFVYIFLPETKGPIKEMILLWQKHWFWKRIVSEQSNYRTTM